MRNKEIDKPTPQTWFSKSSFELTALFIFALIVTSNLFVLQFAKGYFEYYGISLALVNFTPQMYDYERISLYAILTAAIVAIAVFGLIKLTLFSAGKIADSTREPKQLSKFFSFIASNEKRIKVITKALHLILVALIAFAYIYTLLTVVYSWIPSWGYVSAEKTTHLSSISKPDELKQKIIVFKSSEGIIVKPYDTNRKQFDDGHEFIPSDTSYLTHTITIEKQNSP